MGSPAAQAGDTVKVHFTGKTEEGSVFATSYGNHPLEFTIGSGQMLPGVEKAVVGMGIGERKTTKFSADEGYGPHLDELVLVVERIEFPNDFTPEKGMHLELQQADGSVALLTILEVNDANVTLDANHPLAGQPLTFELELLGIEK